MQLLDIFKVDRLDLKEQQKRDKIETLTVPVNPDKLNKAVWPKIRYLCLHEDVFLDHSFCRLSHDHSWLIILGKKVDLNAILSRCSTNLVFLRIDECLSKALDLSHMKQLRFLHIEHSCISRNTAIPLLGLNELTALETLSLEGTFSNTDLDVSAMKSLTQLHIRHNQQFRRVSGFSALEKLKELDICTATEMTELDFSGAQNLECLHLKRMPKLCQLPELHLFQNLRRVHLNSIAAVQKAVDLSGLPELEYLDLSCNKDLTQIDGLERLHKLTYLNLSGTSLRKIPDALRRKGLKTLNLSQLELDFLPDWLLEMGLDFSLKRTEIGICLYDASVKNMDMDIFRSRDSIVQWFDSQKSRTTGKSTAAPTELNDAEASNALLDNRLQRTDYFWRNDVNCRTDVISNSLSTYGYYSEPDRHVISKGILVPSVPIASGELNTLLYRMISACLHLQGNKNYRGWDENGRNSVVRNSLGDNGYIVLDQNLRGTSETGKSYGELDLLIQRVPNRPWVLCEALIVEGYTHKWNEHLDKLLNEYNPHGLSSLFLLTYVDCNKSKFDSIWTKYRQHICNDDPKNFVRMPETVSLDLYSEYAYIKIARCSYRRDSYTPIVYHIFVQMDPKS